MFYMRVMNLTFAALRFYLMFGPCQYFPQICLILPVFHPLFIVFVYENERSWKEVAKIWKKKCLLLERLEKFSGEITSNREKFQNLRW